MCYPVTFYSW